MSVSVSENDYRPIEQYRKFNILGKIYRVKQNLFENTIDFDQFKGFYDENRGEYIIDISPMIFEKILEYYSTKKLFPPTNIHMGYFKETLEKFHIDTSSLDQVQYYQRIVPKQTILQIIYILFEYPDCR